MTGGAIMKGKRFIKVSIYASLAFILLTMPCFSPSEAQTSSKKPLVLDFAEWLPQASPPGGVHPEYFEGLEKATDGAVKVKIHWAQSMGGARALYGMTVEGIAHMANIVPAYTPGVFPMYSLFELPIKFPKAEILVSAVIRMYKKGYFDKEFSDIKVIGFYTLSPYVFHSVKYKITTLNDLKGLKIRASTPSLGKMVKAFGAVPVQATAPELYTSLLKGVVDVDLSPMDALFSFKLIDICKYINEWRTFTIPFVVIMNKGAWKKLPEEGKAYIEKNWENYSRRYGAAYDAVHVKAKEMFLKKPGNEVVNFLPSEGEKINQALAPIWDSWIADMEAKGLPGKKAVDDLYKILTELGIENPLLGYKVR
jgi:TRAP-type C4-dicarboxylate transport system substrate-binding protein